MAARLEKVGKADDRHQIEVDLQRFIGVLTGIVAKIDADMEMPDNGVDQDLPYLYA